MKRPLRLVLLAIALGCTAPPPEGPYATVATALSTISCETSQDTGYDQGTPFEITVVHVDGKPVEEATANAYYVMAQAAHEDGVELVVVSGFRTMEQQTYFYNCYVNCNCNNCNLAAKPGYSNHQSGHALDLNTDAPGVYAWLDAHGADFGWERTVPSEKWHWEWWGGGPGGGPCGAVEPPPPPPEETCVPAPVPGAEDAPFQDMPPGSTGAEEAAALKAAGFATGCSANPPLFCPTCTIDRASLIALLVKTAGLDVSNPGEPLFDDVAPTDWFYAYAQAAKKAGITSGCTATSFCPYANVTRGEAAVLVVKAAKLPLSAYAGTFSDVPATMSAATAVESLKAWCVASGCGDGDFCPAGLLDRAQAAVLVARAFDVAGLNECVSACDLSTCSGPPQCGDWSDCAFQDACATEGTRTRTCTAEACVGEWPTGSCQVGSATDSQPCTREPPCGEDVGTPASDDLAPVVVEAYEPDAGSTAPEASGADASSGSESGGPAAPWPVPPADSHGGCDAGSRSTSIPVHPAFLGVFAVLALRLRRQRR